MKKQKEFLTFQGFVVKLKNSVVFVVEEVFLPFFLNQKHTQIFALF